MSNSEILSNSDNIVVEQVSFYVPLDIRTKLITGEYELFGGVVREALGSKKGQIVKHLDPIDTKVEKLNKAKTKIIPLIKEHKVVSAIVAGGTLLGTGLTIYLVKREPKYVKQFRTALNKYIGEIAEANLTIETIDLLMDSIEELKTHKRYRKKLQVENIAILAGYINQYTIELLEKNNVEFDDKAISLTDDSIIHIQHYLNEQKKLFERAA